MSNRRSLYPRTVEIRNSLRQQRRFIPQPRDERRYSYPPEIDPELTPTTAVEERQMLAIVRAIKVNGKK